MLPTVYSNCQSPWCQDNDKTSEGRKHCPHWILWHSASTNLKFSAGKLHFPTAEAKDLKEAMASPHQQDMPAGEDLGHIHCVEGMILLWWKYWFIEVAFLTWRALAPQVPSIYSSFAYLSNSPASPVCVRSLVDYSSLHQKLEIADCISTFWIWELSASMMEL